MRIKDSRKIKSKQENSIEFKHLAHKIKTAKYLVVKSLNIQKERSISINTISLNLMRKLLGEFHILLHCFKY